MSRFTEWSKMAVASPAQWTPPKPKTRIIVRLMPTIVGQHTVRIKTGEPAAATAINRTSISFPQPFDDHGHPTTACQDFIIETIRDAVRHDRHLRWVQWPNGTTTTCTSSDRITVTTPSSPPVPKPALVIHAEVIDRRDVIEPMTRH